VLIVENLLRNKLFWTRNCHIPVSKMAIEKRMVGTRPIAQSVDQPIFAKINTQSILREKVARNIGLLL
jgi:hypothetical protein